MKKTYQKATVIFRNYLISFAGPYLLAVACGLTLSSRGAVLSWSGDSLTTGNWDDIANWGSAGTPTNGDTLIFLGGKPRSANVNNIAGLTLNQIRFAGASGGYSISGNAFTITNSLAATNTPGTNTFLANITLGGGNVNVEVGSGAGLIMSDSLGGDASLTKFGAGFLIFSGGIANSYTNKTFVNAGTLLLNKTISDSTLHGPLIIGDGLGGANADVVVLANNEQLTDSLTPVTVNSSGLFNLNGIGEWFGSLSGNGNVNLGSGFARIGSDGTSKTFGGVISGAGGVFKVGAGIQTFAGDNTYTGATEVDNGTLIVNGSQPQSPVATVSPGTLGGSGTVGTILGSNGTISPGSSPGILTCSNVTFSAATTFKVELNGSVAGANYDQLNVHGTNNLAGAVLSINANFTTPVGLSNELVIINNDGAEAVIGTFAGYPGSTTYDTGNGYKLLLRYNGGDGNDVSFTVTQLPGDTAGSILSGGNGNGVIDPNECNTFYVIITNKTGAPMTGINATLSSASPQVVVTQPYSSYPDAPGNTTSTNATAFQLSILPGFVCGGNITLNLAVTTAGHGAFTVPLTLASGAVSFSPSRYDNNTTTNIPDVGTIESTNTVSAFAGPIAKVAVSLWTTHALDADLSISLISPDNVLVDLSSGNGAGANFGSGCAPDGNRTTFDDSASTAITAGSPPYVGTFRPEASLAVLNAGSANGNWRLRITDANGGTLGSLRCWSLLLYPLTCAPGGGICDLCPNTTIYGAIGEGNSIQSDRLMRDGFPGSCGFPKFCPGDIFHGSQEYDGHTFRNGPSDSCITVTLTAPTTDLMSVAYLGYFDPNDHCTNYLADSGESTQFSFPIHPITYSFNVASNAVFVVTVNGVDGVRGPYQLSVTGGDCRPALNITSVPTNKVRLDWPTSAGGFRLESTPALTSPSWSTVTNDPVVSSGRYAVTNSSATGNQIYRLHKP